MIELVSPIMYTFGTDNNITYSSHLRGVKINKNSTNNTC